jgi:hypothetical protein
MARVRKVVGVKPPSDPIPYRQMRQALAVFSSSTDWQGRPNAMVRAAAVRGRLSRLSAKRLDEAFAQADAEGAPWCSKP